MSNIVHEILREQDLSRAGELFNISNEILLKDFATTIDIIKTIVDSRKYINHLNEQSIVEIVLTRCISALRDTKIITNYYEELLDLLEICLKYSLHKNDDNKTNTPHANIVSDIFSCILLDYLDLSLSERAIPICIDLLQQGSKELSREINSYLNLLACRDPRLLIHCVGNIVDAILKGNSTLCRLLHQLCEIEIECIYPLTKHLIKALKIVHTDDVVHVLQIMYLISLNHVQLVIVHLDDVIEYLAEDAHQDIVLDVLFSIANQVPIALEPYLCLFEKPNCYDTFKVSKIISTIGRSLKSKSEFCANLLIKKLDNTDKTLHILKEIYSIAVVHPNVLDTCFRSIIHQCENPPYNVKVAIEQLHKLKSSSVLSGNNSSSIIMHTNNHSSMDNSVDSIENGSSYKHPRYVNQANSNDDLGFSKSREVIIATGGITTVYTNGGDNKSFVLNSPSIESDSIDGGSPSKQELSMQSPIPTFNSREFKFNKSFTIHEDDEGVLNDFDNELKEIENNFNGRLSFDEEKFEIQNSTEIIDDNNMIEEVDEENEDQTTISTVPYDIPLEKDVVQQFCEKHLNKIKLFIENLHKFLPLPVECWVEEKDKPGKRPKLLNLNFTCFLKGQNCLFDRHYFEMRTAQPSLWIHIMFLALQSKWSKALTQRDQSIIELRKCYERFKCSDKLQFVPLLTSAFPNEKQQKQLLTELNDIRFFDLFEFNQENQEWFCFLCSNPDKAHDILNDTTLIQGQLREKRGRWKFFKRWKKRLYTLTGGSIVYVKKDMRQESLSVRYIKSIQTVKSNRKIPKAFEIFTNTNSFILKAKNSHDAEQWVQYLHISKAHEISRCNLNDSTIYKTCL